MTASLPRTRNRGSMVRHPRGSEWGRNAPKKTHRASRCPVCFDPLLGEASGPAAADGGVGGRHVVACRLHLLAVGVGLFVDDLEVATQLGDELLAGHRTRAAPEVTGSQ